MENFTEYVNFGDIAYDNGNFVGAQTWYKKALAEKNDDVYVLSRLGAIGISFSEFEEALQYFQDAVRYDPGNGDSVFNLANAYFFNQEYSQAADCYGKALLLPHSDDVPARIYYQLALLCSIRNDWKAAMINLEKSEEADKEHLIAISPDFVSEKIKIYMALHDIENAELCARKLLSIEPSKFENYGMYFSFLMARNELNAAGKILKEAEKYATMDAEQRGELVSLQSAYYLACAKEEPDNSAMYQDKAIEVLLKAASEKGISRGKRGELLMALAETYSNVESYDKAIRILKGLLDRQEVSATIFEVPPFEIQEPQEEEISRMEILDTGEEHVNRFIEYFENEPEELERIWSLYDEDEKFPVETVEVDGEELTMPMLPRDFFDSFERAERLKESGSQPDDTTDEILEENEIAPAVELVERIRFMLLSCYLGKDSFEDALPLSLTLRDSDEVYYQYFGTYTYALISKRLGYKEEAQINMEAIAYFKQRMLEAPGDTLAAVFRARLYAENGKFELARQIAGLLTEEDRADVTAYIDACRDKR